MMIPEVINISEAKLHDQSGLERLIFPKDTIIVEDRVYFYFALIHNRIKAKNIFVTRIKSNTKYETIEGLDLPYNVDQNILKDEIILLTSNKAIWGTSENAVKSHIFVALISYLLLDLIKRTIIKRTIAFSKLSEKIRSCLYHYLSLDYVCNQVREGVRKINLIKQKEIVFEKDIFSS